MEKQISRHATSFQKLKILLTACCVLTSCGKSAPQTKATEKDEGIPVVGVAGFGSQCPYGFTEDPFPARLELWNCPIGVEKVALAEPLRPIYFQVDCKKKTVNVRKENRTMDTAWEIMPDGSFFMTIDGGTAKLQSDAPGRGRCDTPLSVDLIGKIECKDRDQVDIQLESVFWLARKFENANPRNTGVPGQPLTPEPRSGGTSLNSSSSNDASADPASATDTTRACQVPQSCYFYSKTTIKQCR